jgi:acrylyl-CoA reductase (NADPH)
MGLASRAVAHHPRMPDDFPAYLVSERGRGASATSLSRDRLPAGEVLVAVRWSSLNYKDGLAMTAKAPVVRTFPMVPGIDLAGVVVESSSAGFKAGDEVIATGSGLGETIWGGYSAFARVPAEILVRPPKELGLRRAMAFGTAGLTAMLSVMALERAGLPPKSAVAVTGAGGGVGGVAIIILSRLGHRVTAVTGRASEEAYLRGLGAAELFPRDQLAITPEKSLLAERWAGAVDAVGGPLLAGLLRSITTGGAVAVSGMAAGGQLPATVYPFILRGVSLLGIASSVTPMALRREAWARLARDVPAAAIDGLAREASFADLPRLADEIMAGGVRGRYVVKIA